MASADSKAGDAAIESQDSTAPDWMICPITEVSVATQKHLWISFLLPCCLPESPHPLGTATVIPQWWWCSPMIVLAQLQKEMRNIHA